MDSYSPYPQVSYQIHQLRKGCPIILETSGNSNSFVVSALSMLPPRGENTEPGRLGTSGSVLNRREDTSHNGGILSEQVLLFHNPRGDKDHEVRIGLFLASLCKEPLSEER